MMAENELIDDDPDDEEMSETPSDVVLILGFDPQKESPSEERL